MSERQREDGRPELPIERGFPVELVNDIAERETYGGARQHYRPCYTMHKWWAPRTGAVFRTVCLYSLLDDPEAVEVREPGADGSPDDWGGAPDSVAEMIASVSAERPDALWPLYGKDVRVSDKRVLDPLMGGGTSVVEASRFGASVAGNDLNPVAWFTVKKIFDGAETDPEALEAGFEEVAEKVAEDLLGQYRTPCPNGDHDADVISYFWMKELDCASCGETVGLFDDYRVAKGRYDNSERYNVYCPACESVVLVADWQSEQTCECGHSFVPEDGTVSAGDYTCRACGRTYGVTDAVAEQGGYDSRLYATEYYCEECDEHSEREGYSRDQYKGYKRAVAADERRFEAARREWDARTDLREYVPDAEIREGAITSASSVSGNDVFDHGYEEWTDMFNERQLLCLSKLLKAIGEVGDENVEEYLLLAFSDALRLNSGMAVYHHSNNQAVGAFKTKSFGPPTRPLENNLWGTKYGSGTFTSFWEMVVRGVEYARRPTERVLRYPPDEAPSEFAPTDDSLDSQDVTETEPFGTALAADATVRQGDARELDFDGKFDAVITDPPYYDNVVYSEVADYFYVWQRLLLGDRYDCFGPERTPRSESIVANPAEGKGRAEFEDGMRRTFRNVRDHLVADGVLAFTYHHSDAESWGEVLAALCDAGFEVTATYPVSADLNKLERGASVTFDVVVVARPVEETEPISWNALRRRIVRTARETRETLAANRDLTSGDVGVVEMGECFREYSKHHGEVRRAGERMDAEAVVAEIYGIAEGGEVGEQDVYLDLLEERDPSHGDLNDRLERSDASEERMAEMALFGTDGGEFALRDWRDEERRAYVRRTVEADDGDPTTLDVAHFLRDRYERGESFADYCGRWDADALRQLCEGLAEATGDETYLTMLGADESLGGLGSE